MNILYKNFSWRRVLRESKVSQFKHHLVQSYRTFTSTFKFLLSSWDLKVHFSAFYFISAVFLLSYVVSFSFFHISIFLIVIAIISLYLTFLSFCFSFLWFIFVFSQSFLSLSYHLLVLFLRLLRHILDFLSLLCGFIFLLLSSYLSFLSL